ncbi:MAG: hypothetical protein AAFR61_19015 [Bacteroidota bacterium]
MIFNVHSTTQASQTSIGYRLVDPMHVLISVHDEKGHMVRVISDCVQDKGEYSLLLDNRKLSKGPHFIHFRSPHRRQVKRVPLS